MSNKSHKIECFYFWQYVVWPSPSPIFIKNYFWQRVDLPPSPRIFGKNHEILGFETYSLNYPYYFRGTDRKTQSPFKWIFLIEGILQIPLWARLSNKSYKIECFYFWQYVFWPPPSPTFVKKLSHLNFWHGVDLPPSYMDNVNKYTVFFLRLPLIGIFCWNTYYHGHNIFTKMADFEHFTVCTIFAFFFLLVWHSDCFQIYMGVKNRSTFCMIYYSMWPIKVFEGCLRLKKSI